MFGRLIIAIGKNMLEKEQGLENYSRSITRLLCSIIPS